MRRGINPEDDEDVYEFNTEDHPLGSRRGRSYNEGEGYERRDKQPRHESDSEEDERHPLHQERNRDVAASSFRVVHTTEGKSKVEMDIDDWQKIRAFVIQADKYVDEYLQFRSLRSKKAKSYRNRKNKIEEVGQAYGRDNNWNKGSGVN
jgi:hypothetical protein